MENTTPKTEIHASARVHQSAGTLLQDIATHCIGNTVTAVLCDAAEDELVIVFESQAELRIRFPQNENLLAYVAHVKAN